MREPPLARRTGWLASAALVCACAGATPSEPSLGEARVQADRQQLGRVVAYTAGVVDGRCEPGGCQWRVLDPETSNDELVIAPPAAPSRAFWDESHSSVYFLAGRTVYRAAWQAGARPEVVLTVPDSFLTAPNTVDDIWIDERSGTWRASVIALDGASSRASIWEHGSSGAWTVLREMETQCECGDCPCGSVLEPLIQPTRRVTLEALLDGMRVHRHLDVHEPGVPWAEGTHTIPSTAVRGAAIQFDVVFGDSYHAMAPMRYVGPKGDTPREVVPKDGPCPLDQLAFQEDGAFLLVVEEFSGSCGRVVDMRSGRVTTTLPATATNAVWTRRPSRADQSANR